MDDRQKELERIEEALLEELLREEEEEEKEEKKETPIPAFENPDEIRDPEEPLVYCNFSNDYGKELEQENQKRHEQAALRKKKKNDKVIIGLMLAVSVLCVGILGVFIYWLETLMKLL